MDMLQVFHMNKGQGEASYAKNCTVQKKILSLTKSFVEEAIEGYFDNDFPETMTIADLGCSSGPTALAVVSEIIDVVIERCQNMDRHSSPKIMVYLNDLPGNDFNGVFELLCNFQNKFKKDKGDDFEPCFIAGLPGSFYGRLLPNNTLHFVHSSSSLHWLSQVPAGLDGENNRNKGEIYLSETSPREVVNAYMVQFRMDFLSFLKSRAEEVISGGRMVLTLMGRTSNDPTCQQSCYPWNLISQCLTTMLSEGLIEEEKLDSFNVPYYAPCLEELKQLVEEESSFSGQRFEAVEVEWDRDVKVNNNVNIKDDDASCRATLTKGERIAKMHRAVCESMLQHHFGKEIMDHLFHTYATVFDHHLTINPNSKLISLLVSLIRN